jgi:exodeoxyribonuclease VII large subunit
LSDDLDQLKQRAHRAMTHRVQRAESELEHTVARLRALSPAATLERGYAIVQRANGKVARDASKVKNGEEVRLRLAKGELKATVTK